MKERNITIVEKLKVLNILIVEDDDNIRQVLSKFFLDKTNQIHLATNGMDALDKIKNHPEINVIISDINMPKMNGLEMLEQIRKNKNFDGEVIFLTAYSDSSNIIKAIELNISNYLIKPLDLKALILKLDIIAKRIIEKTNMLHKTKELEENMDILNRVAIVSKTNLKGKIIYANDIFCDISGYSKEELYNKPHNIVRHPDVPKEIFKDLWETIKRGDTWRGKVKNLSKDNETYITDTTIYPIFDDMTGDVKEYMSIRFLITEEENEKREFKRNVINKIKETRLKDLKIKKELDELNKSLDEKSKEISTLKQLLYIEKERVSKLNNQIYCYEDEIKEITSDFEIFKISAKNKLLEKASKTKKENEALESKIEEQGKVNEDLQDKINELYHKHEEDLKTIKDLRDIIEHSDNKYPKKK